MPSKQRMRVQSDKHSQNVTIRGNVPKSEVRIISIAPLLITKNFGCRERIMKDIQLDLTYWLCFCLWCVDQVGSH